MRFLISGFIGLGTVVVTILLFFAGIRFGIIPREMGMLFYYWLMVYPAFFICIFLISSLPLVILDKYLQPRNANIFIGSLSGIFTFGLCLFLWQPSLIYLTDVPRYIPMVIMSIGGAASYATLIRLVR